MSGEIAGYCPHLALLAVLAMRTKNFYGGIIDTRRKSSVCLSSFDACRPMSVRRRTASNRYVIKDLANQTTATWWGLPPPAHKRVLCTCRTIHQLSALVTSLQHTHTHHGLLLLLLLQLVETHPSMQWPLQYSLTMERITLKSSNVFTFYILVTFFTFLTFNKIFLKVFIIRKH